MSRQELVVENAKAIDVLVSEIQDARRRLTEIMLSSERVLATSVAVLAVGVNVAIARHYTQALLVVPALADGLLAYMAYMYAELFALGGYCYLLERELARRTGEERLVYWETVIADLRLRSVPRRILHVFVAAVAVALNAAAIVAAAETRRPKHWGHHHSTLIIALTSVGTAVGALLAAAAFLWTWRERQRIIDAGIEAIPRPAAR